MRAGFRVYDSDTHVEPCTEVLDRYVDPSFRARLPELAQYKVIASRPIEGEPERHAYRIGMVRYWGKLSPILRLLVAAAEGGGEQVGPDQASTMTTRTTVSRIWTKKG